MVSISHTLVTGGSGLIGLELVRQLATNGEKIVVFDIRANIAEKLLENMGDNVVFVQGNLASFSHILNTVKNYNISKIYHLGGVLSMTAEDDPWLHNQRQGRRSAGFDRR